jgi:hypothetical protein
MKNKLYKKREVHHRAIVFYVLVFMASLSYAQVGVGNTNPQATLDISASNQATPSNEDGILIPRVDAFPVTNPTASQQGMLIYLTTTVGLNSKGFYHWDQATTSWVKLTSIEKLNDLSDAKSDTDGSSVFIGINAGLTDDSSDNQNVGVGFGALQANVIGQGNTALGYEALTNNTNGGNTAVGYHALNLNVGGFRNTAVGHETLSDNVSGNNNSAFGHGALRSNTGNSNSAFGRNSLSNITSGDNNVAIGTNSGQNLTGGSNVLMGHNAGRGLNGDFNVFIGRNSGQNTTGDSNVFLGNSAGAEASFATASSTLLIQNTAGTIPLIYGDFANNRVGIQKIAATHALEVEGTTEATQYKVSSLNSAPATATSTGVLGEIRITTTHIYICIATDTWVRSPLATW